MTKALLIPIYGAIEEVAVDCVSHAEEIVGGHLEDVPWVFASSPMLYVNKNARHKDRPNRTVTMDGEVQDILFGPILACGVDGEGNMRDITTDEARRVHERFGFTHPTNPDGYGSGFSAYVDILRLADFSED